MAAMELDPVVLKDPVQCLFVLLVLRLQPF